jgi:hypothetical protein
MRSVEYPATIPGVKRGLKAISYSQGRGADETAQSRALVSMVLNRKAKSQPCLDKLAALINRVVATVSEAKAS